MINKNFWKDVSCMLVRVYDENKINEIIRKAEDKEKEAGGYKSSVKSAEEVLLGDFDDEDDEFF